MDDHTPEDVPASDEDDRAAILSRRTFLIEAALVNAGLSVACSNKSNPASPPTHQGGADAGGSAPQAAAPNNDGPDASGSPDVPPDVPPKPAPRPCLKVRPPRPKNEPMVCLDIAPDKDERS